MIRLGRTVSSLLPVLELVLVLAVVPDEAEEQQQRAAAAGRGSVR